MNTELKDLARYAARNEAPENFDLANVNEAFRGELKKIAGSVPMFMKNRYDLYQIVIENADEIVPDKVLDAMGMFAEVKQVADNEKALFKTGVTAASKMRAKKFLTRAGLGGVYESFRLDGTTFEVSAHAIGMGASIDYERLIDGSDTMADLMNIITDSFTDAAYLEVQKALVAAVKNTKMPAANKVVATAFDASKMFKLCNTVKAYARNGSAVIFAPPEFIAEMGPDAIVPVQGNVPGVYHPDDIDAIHRQGYINLFRGVPVVQIPQSFIDTNNDKTWINPAYAYVFPTGGEKVVKIVFEGATQIYDNQNVDRSMEVNAYKKMGAGILTFYNFGVYHNTGIDGSEDPEASFKGYAPVGNPYPNYN